MDILYGEAFQSNMEAQRTFSEWRQNKNTLQLTIQVLTYAQHMSSPCTLLFAARQTQWSIVQPDLVHVQSQREARLLKQKAH